MYSTIYIANITYRASGTKFRANFKNTTKPREVGRQNYIEWLREAKQIMFTLR